MITDSHYIIGSTHQTCQDYTCHNDDIIVVSDGCSSSKDSDIGSRILARSILTNIYRNPSYIINESLSTILSLGLDDTALDATLLFAYYEDDSFKVTISGDGHLITKVDNIVVDYNFSYKNNMPPYLSYSLHSKYSEIIKLYSPVCKLTKTTYLNQNVESVEIIENDNIINHFELPADTIDYLFLTTDGLDSFDSSKVLELTSIKVPTKNFLKRKMLRISESFKHFDDFGCAAFCNLK